MRLRHRTRPEDAPPAPDEPPVEAEPVARGWTAGDVVWMIVPILAILGVVGYFTASVRLGTTPPFAVVDGQSMRPTLNPGDLVVIRGVSAGEVEVGDIIAITPPPDQQQEKSLPSEIVHRVVEKAGEGAEVNFVTKGDNVGGEDPFTVRPGNVRGEVVATVPGLGYPVLFFRSEQGRIFLAALGLAIVGYFVIAAIERRQEAAELESPRYAIEELAAETHALRETLEDSTAGGSVAPPEELHALLADNDEQRATLRQLVGAVGEYGHHLRSHTEVLKGMSAASQDLARVVAELRGTLPAPATAAATPAARPVEEPPAEALLAWLGDHATPGWSLASVPDVADVLGASPAGVRTVLVRLAVQGRADVRRFVAPDLYGYRLRR